MTVRDLPSVDALADDLAVTGLPRVLLVETARHAIATARAALLDGAAADAGEMARREAASLSRRRPQRVINATGVLLHTNLGRAPLHPDAAALAAAAATGYGALELDLATGRRGGRAAYVHSLIAHLTSAEAALVVNNNAGALFLALAALGGGGRVVVSRGELIEIGGSFRLPELMLAAGARLAEVGTTNRTRLADYAAAAPGAALLLKVHPSNYRVEGFTAEVGYAELAGLAGQHDIPLVADLGSGLLDERVPWLDGPPPQWLAGEPATRQVLEAGATVVLFSGDKLLGGPQAGIIAGSAGAVEAMARHPAARALRCGGPTLAALAATLELYADGRGGEVPFWSMAARPYDGLRERAEKLVEAAGIVAEVVEGESVPGAGSIPGSTIPSPVIRVAGRPDDAWRRLLEAAPPVVARRRDDALELDLRAVEPADDKHLAAALAAVT